jgi:hypothetical protein
MVWVTPVQFLAGEAIVLFASCQPSIERSLVLFPVVKWPEREADQPSVINLWRITSRPPHALMVRCLANLFVLQLNNFDSF